MQIFPNKSNYPNLKNRSKKTAFLHTSLLSVIFLLSALALSLGQVINVSCNNNGTMTNSADDYVTFELNPPAPGSGVILPYTYTLTATQAGSPVTVLLSDGTPATNVLYGISSPFRTASGSAGNGSITLTVSANFGNYQPANFTVTDPGICTLPTVCEPGTKTISYRYRSPISTTDAVNWATHIPKFDPNPGRTLTGVSVTLKGDILNGYLFENNSANPINPTANLSANVSFALAGNSIALANNIGSVLNVSYSLPARILVPSNGTTWDGDATGSTLRAMNANPNGWLRSGAFSFLDPKSDPKWVTNLTGNASDDDDIFVAPNNHKTATNTVSYNSPADLAQFTGTSGNIPLTYSTEFSQSGSGTGGNFHEVIRTQTFFEVDITYTYTETCTPLPVKLKSFSGKQTEDFVTLNWNVTEENKVSHYEVEQSADAKIFQKVSQVAAGAKDQYLATDSNPVSGKNYYRLKSVDLDGTFAYSRTISIDFTGDISVKVFPNPVSDEITIDYPYIQNVSSVELLNTRGVVVKTATNIKNGFSVKSLTSGIYILRIVLSNGQKISKSVIVSK